MKLLSHERLVSLQEQLDYLERLFKYTSDEYTMANPDAASPTHVGICTAQAVFDRIGLNESVERIKLEIAFLKDFLDADIVEMETDGVWCRADDEARAEDYASESEIADFLQNAMKK